MELFAKLNLPKALKKANEASIQFKIGEFGEFEQKLQNQSGMLNDMPHVKIHEAEELDSGRARLM